MATIRKFSEKRIYICSRCHCEVELVPGTSVWQLDNGDTVCEHCWYEITEPPFSIDLGGES